MSEALKPCPVPWCKGRAIDMSLNAEGTSAVVCTNCRCAADSIEIWNTRPLETQMLEALEKLAKLGNGDCYGNSNGNQIAQDAIRAAKGDTHD